MSKLTLDALKSRAEATASNDLLATISGGTENDFHTCDYQPSAGYGTGAGNAQMTWHLVTGDCNGGTHQ